MHPQPQIGIVSKLSDGRPHADLVLFARLAKKKETAEKNEKTPTQYAWREQERRRSESKSNMKDLERKEMQGKGEREESDRPSTRKLSHIFRGSAA